MDNRIRPLLNRYADFDFEIDYDEWEVSFSREVASSDGATRQAVDDIKVSRGEENIFIWCFFLAIVQLVLDGAEAYKWVKYIYIDDPISSLDEHNAIAVAQPSGAAARRTRRDRAQDRHLDAPRAVLQRAVQRARRSARRTSYFLHARADGRRLLAVATRSDTPFFHHVASLRRAARGGRSRASSTRTTSTCCGASWRRRPAFFGYGQFARLHQAGRRRPERDAVHSG